VEVRLPLLHEGRHCFPKGRPSGGRQQVLGIDLLDHVILGHGRFVSLKERGCCEQ
jgi:hypothetical protein